MGLNRPAIRSRIVEGSHHLTSLTQLQVIPYKIVSIIIFCRISIGRKKRNRSKQMSIATTSSCPVFNWKIKFTLFFKDPSITRNVFRFLCCECGRVASVSYSTGTRGDVRRRRAHFDSFDFESVTKVGNYGRLGQSCEVKTQTRRDERSC